MKVAVNSFLPARPLKPVVVQRGKEVLSLAEGHYRKADVILRSGFTGQPVIREAMRHLDRALELFPNAAEIWEARGYAFSLLGEEENSRLSSAQGSFIKGLKFREQESYPSAIFWLNSAINHDPEFVAAFQAKVEILEYLRIKGHDIAFDELYKCYDRILELIPENDDALFNKGVCLISENKFDDAAECFKKIEVNSFLYWRAQLNLGGMFFLQGDLDHAEEVFKRVLNASEADEEGRRYAELNLETIKISREEGPHVFTPDEIKIEHFLT